MHGYKLKTWVVKLNKVLKLNKQLIKNVTIIILIIALSITSLIKVSHFKSYVVAEM